VSFSSQFRNALDDAAQEHEPRVNPLANLEELRLKMEAEAAGTGLLEYERPMAGVVPNKNLKTVRRTCRAHSCVCDCVLTVSLLSHCFCFACFSMA